MYNKFSYKVSWCEEESEFIAICVEMPGLSGLGQTEVLAIEQCLLVVRAWEDWTSNETPE